MLWCAPCAWYRAAHGREQRNPRAAPTSQWESGPRVRRCDESDHRAALWVALPLEVATLTFCCAMAIAVGKKKVCLFDSARTVPFFLLFSSSRMRLCVLSNWPALRRQKRKPFFLQTKKEEAVAIDKEGDPLCGSIRVGHGGPPSFVGKRKKKNEKVLPAVHVCVLFGLGPTTSRGHFFVYTYHTLLVLHVIGPLCPGLFLW